MKRWLYWISLILNFDRYKRCEQWFFYLRAESTVLDGFTAQFPQYNSVTPGGTHRYSTLGATVTSAATEGEEIIIERSVGAAIRGFLEIFGA